MNHGYGDASPAICVTPNRFVSWSIAGGGIFDLGDGNFNVSALFKLHVIAVLVDQTVFDAKFPVEVIGTFNRDLGLLREAGMRRRNNFVDGCGHCGSLRLRNRRSIWIRISRGVAKFIVTFFDEHESIVTSRRKPNCPILHTRKMCSWSLPVASRWER